MTVTQRWDTQREHVTTEGRVLTAVYQCTWSDWYDNLIDLPIIGDTWPDDDELVCTDIEVEANGNNTDALVTATFSTEGREGRKNRADQAGSWDVQIQAQMEEQTVTAYYDRTAGVWKSWAAVWSERGENYTEENRPDLVTHTPRMALTLTLMGSVLHLNRLRQYIGKVNSVSFLEPLLAKLSAAQPSHRDDVGGFEDEEKWLFQDMNIDRENKNAWRHTLTFIYDPDDWNTQHGLGVNLYEKGDFIKLISGMDKIEADTRNAGNR